ncbi:hypothetical protein HEK616_84010 (plasmid) [Streptomyces nigrescens]|uniref:Uncharacterized protein n=1 Tax=Streptomyces nigrescens TaxID=1920 RepID=A0ABN6RE65_STRNI|nr:hypothetical protein HEK616_84010 [Streptomyces nigrescens]
MRLFVVHDAEGRIYEALTCPSDVPAPGLATAPGRYLTEMEPPEGFADGSNSDFIREFMKTHRVEVTGQKAIAVRH